MKKMQEKNILLISEIVSLLAAMVQVVVLIFRPNVLALATCGMLVISFWKAKKTRDAIIDKEIENDLKEKYPFYRDMKHDE